MQEIQLLSDQVIDQIAAGEVVERPAHLVKELIENSLDAEATDIIIRVSEGGREVSVEDNGFGLDSDNLNKALSRHTTSKIRKASDLWSLSTYGFRGEALASISAVSKLTLSSRTKNQNQGYRIDSEFGIQTEQVPMGHSLGTKVQIKDLFANVPARLKFMKSAAGEVTAIKQVVKAIALANYQVSIQFFVENKLDLHYPAQKNRIQRVEQILDLSGLYEGYAERDGVKAYSVMASPHTVAKTAKNIWIFAQNRWVQDRSLQAAIMDAYRTMLMHGEYPFVVTWVEASPDQIDVNIHPTKSQVKFANPSLAYRAVAASVRETLEKAPWVEKIAGYSDSQNLEKKNSFAMPDTGFAASNLNANLSFQANEFVSTQYQIKPTIAELKSSSNRTVYQSQHQIQQQGHIQEDEKQSLLQENSVKIKQWQNLQILGQANLTYLVCQKSEGLVFIDQHAAHERVLFEKVMASWKSGHVQTQEFLFPLSIDLLTEQKEVLLKESENLSKLGVFLEELGPQTLGIKSAPLWMKESALPEVLVKMAEQILDFGGGFQFDQYVSDLAARLACHSAVRAGQALSLDEMHSLLVGMDEFIMSSFCPHGRPVSVEYAYYQLEKDFGRVLS